MSTKVQSGWPTFAGVVAIVVGAFHVLSGIGAIAEDDLTQQVQEVLYGIDISVWGWFWLVIGILQLVTGVLIIQRSPIGQILGVVFASLSAIMTVFLIFAFPLWAILVLFTDMAIIYGLLVYGDEFG